MGKEIYLQRGNSDDTNITYLTNLDSNVEITDKFYVIKYDGKITVLVGGVDKKKIEKYGDISKIISFSKYSDYDIRGDIEEETKVLRKFLEDYDVKNINTGPKFPSYIFNKLQQDYDIHSMGKNPISEERKIKKKYEIDNLRSIQEITEKGMKHAEKILRQSKVNKNKELVWDNTVLTSEELQKQIKNFLNKEGVLTPQKYIVAIGQDSADPHERGSGKIKTNVPILIDIFPKSNSGYYGDMTRTFVKGKPPEQLENMGNAVTEALNEALDTIESDIKSCKVHKVVCDVLEKHGYKTGTNNDYGFTHSTGHSIGLELHENPRISGKDEKLRDNMILTIEPGLYYENIGGVRIENMIRVTENGFEDFNNMDKNLIIV